MKRWSARALTYAALLAAAWVFLAPLAWVAATSAKSEEEVHADPTRWLPAVPAPPPGANPPSAGRPLLLGPVRLLAADGTEYEPGAGRPAGGRWAVREGAVRFTEAARAGRPYAEADYQFGPAGTWEVELVTEPPFPPDDLAAVQLDYQPDDTWHALRCRVERPAGGPLAAARAVPLAGTRPASQQWRAGGDDPGVPRLRDWVGLEPDGGPAAGLGPRQVRVILTVTRSDRLGAAAAKARFHYDRVAASVPFWRYFRTGLFLALAGAVLTTLSSAAAAYAFARLSWPGRDFCFVLLLATVLFPPQVTLVPRFLVWERLGAYDTLFPLWVPAALGNAVFVVLLREAVRAIPRELEDAARMDGCGPAGVFRHVVLPHAAPSLAAIAALAFLGSWSDFLGPLLFLADQRLYPLSFGVFALAVQSGNEPTLTAAGAVLLAVPPVACFVFLQRQVTRLALAPAGRG